MSRVRFSESRSALSRLILPALGSLAALLQGQVRDVALRHNTAVFEMRRGGMEIEFLSNSTFRVQRCESSACPTLPGVQTRIAVTVKKTARAIELAGEYVTIKVERERGLLNVTTSYREALFEEIPGTGILEWNPKPTERLYGLGIRPGQDLNLRGAVHQTNRALLISNSGFGLFVPGTGPFEFDLRTRVRISGGSPSRREFLVYYGPLAKSILEEHRGNSGGIGTVTLRDTGIHPAAPAFATAAKARDPRDAAAQLAQGSYSAVVAPVFGVSAPLRPLAPWLPVIHQSRPDPDIASMRQRWSHYLLTYYWEARDLGVPVARALGFEYTKDEEACKIQDQYQLGDEVMVAAGPRAYLPRGIWTDLNTNVAHPGRRFLDIPGVTVYARNGSILPLLSGKVMELHYFPRLGGEFFIAEEGPKTYSKAHAGPAGEFLRLEMEPVITRDYEWIVHNVTDFTEVTPKGVQLEPGAARYDAGRRNLHIRFHAAAGSDAILNVMLKTPL